MHPGTTEIERNEDGDLRPSPPISEGNLVKISIAIGYNYYWDLMFTPGDMHPTKEG